MKPHPLLLGLAAPVLRRLPPWWAVRVYARLGEQYHQGGFAGRVVRRKVRPHGFAVELELDDWSERLAYACGCYYDVEGTAVVAQLVRSGDLFVDVGANVGFMSLLAARQVGPTGRVVSFEPNPRLVERLRHAARANGLEHMQIEACALGDAPGEARLDLSNHSGTASLRQASRDGVTVPVRLGDEALLPHLDALPDAPLFVKVDVEGFEHRVLKGLARTLARRDAALLVEVTDRWLHEAGTSAVALLDELAALGFVPWVPRGGPDSKLRLSAPASPAERPFQFDVLLVRPHGIWRERAAGAGLLP